jgi:hypothetical protein
MPAPKPDPEDGKPLGLLVTVAPMWMIRDAAASDDADKWRRKGKVIVMDADHEDIQIVDVDGEDFHLHVKVTPKGKGK